jgi:hypothetical protein
MMGVPRWCKTEQFNSKTMKLLAVVVVCDKQVQFVHRGAGAFAIFHVGGWKVRFFFGLAHLPFALLSDMANVFDIRGRWRWTS